MCEGGTEKEYADSFAEAQKNPRVRIQAIGHSGVPMSVVRYAKDLRKANEEDVARKGDENLRFDVIWAVFDVDDHPQFAQAIDMARSNKIETAISNPSFELWLLLHFRLQPGMQHREAVLKLLKQYDPTYDKHISFSLYYPHFEDALRRARELDSFAEDVKDAGRNPTTGYWRLKSSIRTSA